MKENFNRYMYGLTIGMCGEYLYRVGYLIFPLLLVILGIMIMIFDFIIQRLEKKEIHGSYKWIEVKKYKDDPNLSWEERYKRLEQHHIEETTFLIEKVKQKVR